MLIFVKVCLRSSKPGSHSAPSVRRAGSSNTTTSTSSATPDFCATVVPVEMGGQWRDTASSARTVCDLLRLLATADPSVALVSAMHPSVVAFWLLNPDPAQPEWEAQRQAVFASAAAGEQWGTITSEPGSGGDIGRTRCDGDADDDQPFLVGRSYASAATSTSGAARASPIG